MIRGIFLALIGLAIVYVGYQIFDLQYARSKVADAPQAYRMTAEGADLTVVEFLDYGCPYCREIHPTITQAVHRDGKINYIVRPIDFLGPESTYAANIAHASAQQGKFFQMHNVLIENYENLDNYTLETLANEAGADSVALKKSTKSKAVEDRATENMSLFSKLGHQSTPTFMIGKKIIYVPESTMPNVEEFLDMFAKAREESK